MIGIAIFIFIIIFFMQKNSGQRRMQSIRKQLNESRTASEDYGGGLYASDTGSTKTKPAPRGNYGNRYNGRVKQTAAGHMHFKDNKGLALEDREHDWLAMQLREEARMKRNIDMDMHDLKEEHRRLHRMINNG